MGEPDPIKLEPHLVAQPVADSEPQEQLHQAAADDSHQATADVPHQATGDNLASLSEPQDKPQEKVEPETELQEKELMLLEPQEKLYASTDSQGQEKAYSDLHEKAYNEQNWQVVALGSVCQLEGCKYAGENGVSRRMHRHCLQLTPTGGRCTYNTERTSNLPGHDRVHLKGDLEKEDGGHGAQSGDSGKPKKGLKRKVEKALLTEGQQTAFADVGASDEQMADLQRKGIQFVEDCRLYRPREIKDCLLGNPREEKRETEARQLLVKIDSFLRKSGCSIGDLDLGFGES